MVSIKWIMVLMEGLFVITMTAGAVHCAVDTTRLRDVGDFNSQLNYFLNSVRITPAEIAKLTQVYKDVEEVTQNIWPGSKVLIYGSLVTGLGMKSSDLDSTVTLPNTMDSISREQCLERIKSFMESSQTKFTNITVSTHTFPVLKCLHRPADKHVDITCKNDINVRDSNLIAYMMSLDKRALDLAMIIKYWGKKHSLSGNSLKTGHAVLMHTLLYLQQKNVLPNIAQLQKNAESIIVNNWETGFNENFDFQPVNNETFYKLLGGFFEYYNNFDYDTYIISPYVGRPVRRDLFVHLDDVPDDFQLYKHNVRSKITNPLNINASMVTQDPFQHNSGDVESSELAENIIKHFKYAADMYKEKHEKDFLAAILGEIILLDTTDTVKEHSRAIYIAEK